MSHGLDLLAHCILVAKGIGNFVLLFGFLKIYGDISFHLRKNKQALVAFEFMRDIGYEAQDEKMIAQAYRCLGFIYKELGQYDLSLVCFKKILALSWVHKEKDMELESIKNLAFLYYYKGLVDESRIFMDRAMRGVFEADHSHQKKIAIQ